MVDINVSYLEYRSKHQLEIKGEAKFSASVEKWITPGRYVFELAGSSSDLSPGRFTVWFTPDTRSHPGADFMDPLCAKE